MTSWTWVAKTLKNLRLAVPAPSAAGQMPQSRSPPLMSAQGLTVPPKPKKPLTPYFRFLGQVRENVRKENPNLKVTELMKKVALSWDQLDEQKKSQYITAYKKELEGYVTTLKQYNLSLTPEQKELREQIKLETQMNREKREKKKRLRELEKPKKPASGFLLFMQSKVPPGSSIEVHQIAAKELGAKWKTLSDAEKGPFVKKYQDNLLQYEKDLVKWEEKMIKQGNEDLVRTSHLSLNKGLKAKSR